MTPACAGLRARGGLVPGRALSPAADGFARTQARGLAVLAQVDHVPSPVASAPPLGGPRGFLGQAFGAPRGPNAVAVFGLKL